MKTLVQLTAAVLITCSTALAQDSARGQTPSDDTYVIGVKTQAEMSATLAERMKFGYESYGLGRRLAPYLHQMSEDTLRCLARTGDAGAAMALFSRLTDGNDRNLTRLPEAEEIALEQYRLVGHTILINQTAQRYSFAATEQCTKEANLDKTCVRGNPNFHKAAAWYTLCEKLGDPVCTAGLLKLALYGDVDNRAADIDSEALLPRTQPAPDTVETYAYQCRKNQN